jgi:hypothetical protein
MMTPSPASKPIDEANGPIEGQMYPLLRLRQLSLPDYSPVDVRTIDSNFLIPRLAI